MLLCYFCGCKPTRCGGCWGCRRYGSPWVCLHKCIFVADMVLGKRSPATTKGFAAALLAAALPAEEQEVQRYYVDPQNTAER